MTTFGQPRAPWVKAAASPPVSPRDGKGSPSSRNGNGSSNGSAAPSGLSPGAARALIALDIIVAGLCPFWQGIVTQSRGFDGAFMTVLETGSYISGGAVMAFYMLGPAGLVRCFNPWAYLNFLPSSVAFTLSNICTYIAVKGLGASQFTLMVQMRIVVLALHARLWRQAKQSALEWAALVQLVLGVLALVAIEQQREPSSGGEDEDDEFLDSVLALLGVIMFSGLALIYMESVLKSNAHVPIYIQQHQLQMVGFLAAVFLYSRPKVEEAELVPASMTNDSLRILQEDDDDEPLIGDQAGIAILLVLLVLKGCLCSVVIKNLDVITKGLVDVSSIILCALLQIVFEGEPFVPSIAALQLIMCLSILMYFTAREETASQEKAAKSAPE